MKCISIIIANVLVVSIWAQISPAQTIIDIENAPQAVTVRGGLGTGGYVPAEREKPFLAALPARDRTVGSMLDDQTVYDLAAKKGQPVSWFGIVRGIRQREAGIYELVIEHKYFDGLTDTHILALSFNGAGDFILHIEAEKPPQLLELVRAYGTVSDVKDGKAVLDAKYMRVFPWKTFTFLEAYGKDTSNAEWRKLLRVPIDRIYDPRPDDNYYVQRLGARPAAPAAPATQPVAPATQPAAETPGKVGVLDIVLGLVNFGPAPEMNTVSAHIAYQETMLILTSRGGVAAITFGEPIEEGVNYRFRFLASGKDVIETGQSSVFEKYLRIGENPTRVVDIGSHLFISAGPMRILWSLGSRQSGWIYYSPESVRVQIANPTDFETIDLKRFAW